MTTEGDGDGLESYVQAMPMTEHDGPIRLYTGRVAWMVAHLCKLSTVLTLLAMLQ